MSPNELPDDAMVPFGWVRKHFIPRESASDHRLVTTGQASSELGYSAATWRGWADEGLIPGAFRDDGEGNWRLPLQACRDHIERLRNPGRRRKRGPWGAQTAQAGGIGAADVSGGKVVPMRSAPVGRRPADHAEPEGRGLAG